MIAKSCGLAACLLLAACGGGGGTGADGAAQSARADDGWDATKACDMLTKSEVSSILGAPVGETELSAVNTFEQGGAAVSTCDYMDGDTRLANVLLRDAYEGETMDSTIESMRAGELMKYEELTAPAGQTIFWQPDGHQYTWFPGDGRMIIVTMGFEAGPDAQTQAGALAKAAA